MSAECMWVEKVEVPVKPSDIGMELAAGLTADVALVVVAMLGEWRSWPESLNAVRTHAEGICEHLSLETLKESRRIVAIVAAAIDAAMVGRI